MAVQTPEAVLLRRGSEANPSLRFEEDEDTGFYHISAGVVGLGINGSEVARWTATALTAAGAIISPDSQGVYFGTGSDSRIYYDGTDTFWDLRAVGTGNLMVAMAAGFPSPDGESTHFWRGTAGSVTADAASVLVVEGSDTANVYISILNPNTAAGGILFGSPTANNRGQILYHGASDSPADTMAFYISGTSRLRFGASAFTFQQSTIISTASGDLTVRGASNRDVFIGEGTIIRVDGGEKNVGFDSITTGSAVSFNNTIGREFTTSTGAQIHMPGQTTTFTNASGTRAVGAAVFFGIPTWAGDNATLTITQPATFYIAGVPVASTNVTFTNAALAMWVAAGEVRIDGDIGDTTNRVTKLWTVDQDTTNAENVSSWGRSKVGIEAYTERALDIIGQIQVISAEHLRTLDPSGRRKLTVLAESINEPLVTPYGEYAGGLGQGPRVDMMGLAALNLKAIQELHNEVSDLKTENRELRTLIGA